MDYQIFNTPIKNRTLFLDGDWIMYRCAFSLEKRTVKVYDDKGVFFKEYKNKTAFKKDIENYNPSYTITDCQTLPKNYQSSLAYKVRSTIQELMRETKCTDVIICLQGDSNFRNRLDLPQKYKGNRKEKTKPLAADETREFLLANYNCILSNDEEADDILSKAQFYSFNNNNSNIVVCTLDKDNRSIPSYHNCLYHPEGKMYIQTSGLGSLELKVKVSESGNRTTKLYGNGRAFFYYQLLHGDSIDNYFPCDIRKFLDNNTSKSPLLSDTKVYDLLKDCKTDEEYLRVVAKQYYTWYSKVKSWVTHDGRTVLGNWLDILQMYVDVVHMRRFDKDRIIIKKLLLQNNIIDDKNNLV